MKQTIIYTLLLLLTVITGCEKDKDCSTQVEYYYFEKKNPSHWINNTYFSICDDSGIQSFKNNTPSGYEWYFR